MFVLALIFILQVYAPGEEGTFSIIGRDPSTGELGIGVQSRTISVGSRTRSAKGGVAVIAHQASSNPYYGEMGIELIEKGMTPEQALDFLLRSDDGRESRQVAILDAQGRTAAFTGNQPNEWKGHKCGANYCAQGNILAGPNVVENMARAFETTTGPLAERLLAALEAAQAAGGDQRGTQSASIMVVKPLSGPAGFSDRTVDLRVDESRAPIPELRRILNVMRSGEMLTDANRKANGGDLNGALAAAIAARDKAPANDNAWVAIANFNLRLNRKPEAMEALRKAIELNSGNKRQLMRNQNFRQLHDDPDFLRIIGN